MSDLVSRFDTLLVNSEFLFVVYYRGHWCPFCCSYLRQLQSLTKSIAAANGTSLAITAEPASELPATVSATGYTGETFVDPEHVLVKELKQRGLLDVAISDRKGYEYGMAQPAVLVLGKDGTVLYSWAIVPSMMNFGGAKDRPVLGQIWDNVEAQLKGRPQVHKKYAHTSVGGLLKEKLLG